MRCVIAGFGLAAAAARCAQAFALHRPQRALMIGLCGSFDLDSLPLATLFLAERVAVDGIGAGEGDDFIAAEAMGFGGLKGERDGCLSLTTDTWLPVLQTPPPSGLLLSVAAAAAGSRMIAARRRRHPEALAEDMESHAAALAAQDARVALQVLRAVSNVVGDRRLENWSMDAAFARLRAALAALPSA